MQVSIHASAREATIPAFTESEKKEVSIHASAREATGPAGPLFDNYIEFQSTPPHGRRHVT